MKKFANQFIRMRYAVLVDREQLTNVLDVYREVCGERVIERCERCWPSTGDDWCVCFKALDSEMEQIKDMMNGRHEFASVRLVKAF